MHGGVNTRNTTVPPDPSQGIDGRNNSDRDELSRSLYAARRAAGLGQIEAATRAGTSQNKVSRVENGKGLLTVAEAAALLTVHGVHGGERRRAVGDHPVADAGSGAATARLPPV